MQHHGYDFCGQTPNVGTELDLPQERYLLLVRQLRDEAGGRHGWKTAVGKRLGIRQSHVTQLDNGSKKPGLDIVTRAMESLDLHRDFFFAAIEGEPDYRDFVGVQDSYVETDPHPAFAQLEEEGFIDYARAQGVDEVLLRHERNTPYARGGVDYAEMRRRIESLIIRSGYASRGAELEEAREARERRQREGKTTEKLGAPKGG